MGVWLYPVSSEGGYWFTDAHDVERSTSFDGVAEAIRAGTFPRETWWPCVQNAAHVEAGDDLFLYTGEEDIGIFAAGHIVGAERQPDGTWLLGWSIDTKRSQALLEKPVAAAKVRAHVHPRVTVRDFSAGAKALRKSLR